MPFSFQEGSIWQRRKESHRKRRRFTIHNQNTLQHAKGELSVNGGTHAVIIGGSMAGLLAGRILADHFDKVTIIERDRFPEAPAPRPGVPQAHHLHALLMRGRTILEQLFPGLGNELVMAGATVVDAAEDFAWLTPPGWGIRFHSCLAVLTFTRGLLDWTVRGRLAAFAQARFLDQCVATGLLPDTGGTGVTGVSVCRRHRPNGGSAGIEELHADLVVDASGRGSKVPQWLAALGYESQQETVVNAHLDHASRLYERPAGF
jgi:2-polyprenyl-6-methoxyphenol hydroxylase-like FAD-dependent oxidoreductase